MSKATFETLRDKFINLRGSGCTQGDSPDNFFDVDHLRGVNEMNDEAISGLKLLSLGLFRDAHR